MDSVLDVVRKECEHCDCLQVTIQNPIFGISDILLKFPGGALFENAHVFLGTIFPEHFLRWDLLHDTSRHNVPDAVQFFHQMQLIPFPAKTFNLSIVD